MIIMILQSKHFESSQYKTLQPVNAAHMSKLHTPYLSLRDFRTLSGAYEDLMDMSEPSHQALELLQHTLLRSRLPSQG